jgi:GNAT superfamily N-acetyltransferase
VTERFEIRVAVPEDALIIAQHRAAMFSDMGILPPDLAPQLEAATVAYLRDALPRGEYHGWLATGGGDPATIVAGAGVQLRRVLPFPQRQGSVERVATGRQAIVLNVYTAPSWRRQGVARSLMERIIAWARAEGIESLVLHASQNGRALYQQLGFVATNEMRLRE